MISPKPTVPPLSTEQAAKFLSGLIYERLLHCIDNQALVEMEQEIAFALHECGFDMTECIEGALGMVQVALVRFANNPKGWSPAQSQTLDSDNEDDCPLCQDFEAESAPPKPRPRPPARKTAS